MRSLSQRYLHRFRGVATEHTHQISNITAYIFITLNSLELLAVKVLLVAELLTSVQNSLKKRQRELRFLWSLPFN